MNVVEPIKLRRSEKGILGRMSVAKRDLVNSASGQCCRADLCIVEESLPMRVFKARAGSSTLVSVGMKDRARGVAIKERISPNPGVY